MSVKTILHISDTHGKHNQLGELPHADMIIHSGDFTLGGSEGEVMDFLNWFLDLPHRHKILVAGNHDDCLYGANIDGLDSNCHYLCNSDVTIEGLRIYGLPLFMNDCISDEHERQIEAIPDDIDILVSHEPPLGILDLSGSTHYGSPSLLTKVAAIKPCYHLFGHIHDARGRYKTGDTVFINSAVVDENYNLCGSELNLINVL